MDWKPATLPGTGWPCELLWIRHHTAWVWRASRVTARGAWCWRVDNGEVNVTRGNRGVAKSAAARAMKGSP